MDVKNNGICRNFFIAKGSGHVEHLLIRIVTIPALLVANTPLGRQLHSSRQPCVALNDLRHGISINKIIIQLACIGPKTGETVIGGAKVKVRFVGVVKKNSVTKMMMDAHEKRDGRIQGISAGMISVSIGIPILISGAPPVKIA